MKTYRQFALVVALSLPVSVFAAKANRDKGPETTPAAKFAVIDKDGDGIISESEYVTAEKDRLGDEAAKKHFAELDKNNDGKLSKEEFGTDSSGSKEKPRGGKKKKKKTSE